MVPTFYVKRCPSYVCITQHNIRLHLLTGIAVLFPQFLGKCKLVKRGHGPHSSHLVNCVVLCIVCVDCVVLCTVCVDCVVLCIVCVDCVVLCTVYV